MTLTGNIVAQLLFKTILIISHKKNLKNSDTPRVACNSENSSDVYEVFEGALTSKCGSL